MSPVQSTYFNSVMQKRMLELADLEYPDLEEKKRIGKLIKEAVKIHVEKLEKKI